MATVMFVEDHWKPVGTKYYLGNGPGRNLRLAPSIVFPAIKGLQNVGKWLLSNLRRGHFRQCR